MVEEEEEKKEVEEEEENEDVLKTKTKVRGKKIKLQPIPSHYRECEKLDNNVDDNNHEHKTNPPIRSHRQTFPRKTSTLFSLEIDKYNHIRLFPVQSDVLRRNLHSQK